MKLQLVRRQNALSGRLKKNKQKFLNENLKQNVRNVQKMQEHLWKMQRVQDMARTYHIQCWRWTVKYIYLPALWQIFNETSHSALPHS